MKTKTLRWIKGASAICLIAMIAVLATDLAGARTQLRQMRECAQREDAQRVRLVHKMLAAREDALAAGCTNASK